jgi:hypothetical protein
LLTICNAPDARVIVVEWLALEGIRQYYNTTVLSFESLLNLAAACLWLKSIVNTTQVCNRF